MAYSVYDNVSYQIDKRSCYNFVLQYAHLKVCICLYAYSVGHAPLELCQMQSDTIVKCNFLKPIIHSQII